MAVSVKLGADIDRRLRALAREMSCSHHFMMCEAIRRYVEDQEARLQQDRKTIAEPAEADADADAFEIQIRPFRRAAASRI